MSYSGDELDAMARAKNYYRWILSYWRQYLRGRVVELGAGVGTFSAYLLDEPVERVTLIEPASDLVLRLRERFRNDRVHIRHGEFVAFRHELLRERVNCVITVNVLEHIPDDIGVIRLAYEVLVPGGTLLIFVPAIPFLYGPMDRRFGHVRRYTKTRLVALLHEAGFKITLVRYLNVVGGLSWLVVGRVFRCAKLTPAMVSLADRTAIPLSAWLERFGEPPLGQSLVAVAQKG